MTIDIGEFTHCLLIVTCSTGLNEIITLIERDCKHRLYLNLHKTLHLIIV